MVREKGLEPLHLGRKNLNLVRLPISPLPLSEHIFQSRYGVADGARTHDNRNHNPGLYQLSYSHHRERNNLTDVDAWRVLKESNLRPTA